MPAGQISRQVARTKLAGVVNKDRSASATNATGTPPAAATSGTQPASTPAPSTPATKATGTPPVTATSGTQPAGTPAPSTPATQPAGTPPATTTVATSNAYGLTGASTLAQSYAAHADADAQAVASSQKGYEILITQNVLSPDDLGHSAELARLADKATADAKAADDASAKAAKETVLTDALTDANTAQNAEAMAQQDLKDYTTELAKTSLKNCPVAGVDASGKPTFTYKHSFLPMRGCPDAAKLYYFQASGTTSVANQVQYVYDHAQSTNQVNADLLTATFSYLGGFQAVLAGTATSGQSQAAATTATTPAPTDAVTTAVAKIKQGGDFNIRTPFPLIRHVGPNLATDVKFLPNVGFTINGLTGQPTVTESTEYTGNFPIDGYFELGAIPESGKPATVFYVDVRLAGQVISPTLASKIGTGQAFFLGQFAGGIEFAQSVRFGFQYFVGPSQSYCVPASAGGCTAVTGSVSGAHVTVSFTPPAKK